MWYRKKSVNVYKVKYMCKVVYVDKKVYKSRQQEPLSFQCYRNFKFYIPTLHKPQSCDSLKFADQTPQVEDPAASKPSPPRKKSFTFKPRSIFLWYQLPIFPQNGLRWLQFLSPPRSPAAIHQVSPQTPGNLFPKLYSATNFVRNSILFLRPFLLLMKCAPGPHCSTLALFWRSQLGPSEWPS